jgi:hypothetical protein
VQMVMAVASPSQPRIKNMKDSVVVFTAQLTAEPAALVDVEVRPRSATIEPGGQHQFHAVVILSDGSERAISPGWSANGGSISSGGLFTAGSAEGTFGVVATHESGLADTVPVAVVQPQATVAAVVVSPVTDTLTVGRTKQFVARLYDASGNTLDGRSVTWSTTSPEVAAVNSSGGVTGNEPGNATITAAADDVSGDATIQVVADAPAITRIRIRPETASLTPGGTEAFAAVALLDDGSEQSVTAAWAATGGAISAVGVYTAGTSEGTFQVIARYQETFADTAVVTVAAEGPGEAASVYVTPATVRISGLGRTVQLAAEARDAAGTVIPDASFVWSSEDSNIASVSQEGIVMSTGLGQVIIMAALLCGTTACDAGSLVGAAQVQVDPGDRAARYPNEPAGYVPWFEHDWQTFPTSQGGVVAASEVGLIHLTEFPEGFELVDDPAAPHGKGKSLRHRLPEGQLVGTSSGVFNLYSPKPGTGQSTSFNDQVRLQSVYRSHWVYMEPDPVTDDFMLGIQHMRYFWGNRQIDHRHVTVGFTSPPEAWNGAPQRVRRWLGHSYLYFTGAGGGYNIDYGSRSIPIGAWHHIEVLIEAGPNEGTMTDSRIRAWIDGELVQDFVLTHYIGYAFAQDHFSALLLAGIDGWRRIQDDFIRFGDIYVSGIVLQE